MPMKVPDSIEVEIVESVLTPDLTLKLYSNDKTPANGDSTAAYTEVVGGNYVDKPLEFADWTINSGTPTIASHPAQTWIFDGPVGGPNTIYGYYVVRDSDNQLMWAERFPAANVPFSPINGSKVVILPRFSAESLF